MNPYDYPPESYFKEVEPILKVCSISGKLFPEDDKWIFEGGECFHYSQIENFVKSLGLTDSQQQELIIIIKKDNI